MEMRISFKIYSWKKSLELVENDYLGGNGSRGYGRVIFTNKNRLEIIMKLYKTTFTPTSNFATTLKGDTLFGQICWAIRYTFGNDKLSFYSNYETSPFLIVSDGFTKGYIPKPSLPSNLLGEDNDLKKKIEKMFG